MNVHEAKTHLSKLLEKVAAGEEVVISKAGKPVAKLVPYQPAAAPRQGGFLAGQIWQAPDCWEDDPELISMMTDGPLFPEAIPSSKVAEEHAPCRDL
jgi:prevent-host-death family protein